MRRIRIAKKANLKTWVVIAALLLCFVAGHKPMTRNLQAAGREPPVQLPPGVGDSWWAAVQQNIRRSEYEISWQEKTCLGDLKAAYQAPNRAQNLRTYFSPTGIRVVRRTESAPSWEWGLSLTGYGYAGMVKPVAEANLVPKGNRIEYQRAGVIEWYVNDAKGLEQGFTITAPPETNGKEKQSEVVLEMAVTGDLKGRLANDGGSVTFATARSKDIISYGRLLAKDATGRQLGSRILLSDGQLNLQIDASGAVYPLVVDPVITGLSPTADWMAESNHAGAFFGYSVGTAGDVNSDGYDDVIVGAPYYDNGQNDEGAVFVWYGSPSGLGPNGNPTNADWMAESNQNNAWLGWSVGTAGDVNGDGYDDVIVGALLYDNPQDAEGAVFVWYGSASGLGPNGDPTNADWKAEGNTHNARFGQSVGTAGDVDGDSYDDVIVGAAWDNGQVDEGAAFVWYGSASGLGPNGDPTNADWMAESNQQMAGFGFSVGTAGDINDDGYDDVIVGAWYYENGQEQEEEGAAFVWYGSASGLGPNGNPGNADWTAEGNQPGARFGRSVGTAGDVNGDGYDDVIVGAPYYDNGQNDEGVVFVWYGSASGLGPNGSPGNADWMAEGNNPGARFGWSVGTAGDVNGDGYDDVIVGAHYYDNGQNDEGAAFVYHGSCAALSTRANWMVEGNQPGTRFGTSVGTAGDVDGDGYDDVIVGAPLYDNGQANEGAAFVYHGSTEPSGPYWCGDEGTVYLPADQSGPNGVPDCYVNWHDVKIIADNWLSQWEASNYVYRPIPLDGGGYVRCVSGSPHNPCLVIAGVDVAGIFRSTDGGLSWSMADDGLVDGWDYCVADVAFAPSDSNRVYAATGTSYPTDFHGHLLVSNDAGQTWTIKDTILAFGGMVVYQNGKVIVVDPCDADHLWVGTCYTIDGVMESTDGGDSWTSRGPANVGFIYVLMADPCDPATLYAGAGADEVNNVTGENGLWKSTDAGLSWTKVYNSRVCDMAISPNRRIVVCGDSNSNTVQSSTDRGSTWSAFNTGLPANGAATYEWQVVAADPYNPGRFIIAAHAFVNPKVYLKEDELSNWTPLDSALSTMYRPYGTPGVDGWQGWHYMFAACTSDMEFHPGVPDKVYMTTWYTVEVSTDGGINWVARNKGLRITVGHTAIWDAYEPDYAYLGYFDVGAHTGIVPRYYSHRPISVQSIGDTVRGWNAIPCQFSYGPNTITLFGASGAGDSWIHRRENHDPWTLVWDNNSCGNPPPATTGWTWVYFGAHPTSGLVFAKLGNRMAIRSTNGGVDWACYSDDVATTAQQEDGNVSPITYDAGRNKWRVNVSGNDYEADTPGTGNWSVDPHPDWVVHPADSQLIYRLDYNDVFYLYKLYRSTDGGTTWPEPPNPIYTSGVACGPPECAHLTLTSDPNILYVDWAPVWAATTIEMSTDTGDTWTELPPIPGHHLIGIYPNPQEPTRFILSSSGVGFWQGEVVLAGDITPFELPGWYHVNLFDLAEMASHWLDCTDPANPNCVP